MNRRDFLRTLGAGAAAVMAPGAGAGKPPVRRPNLLILFTDDQRYDALGCAGNRRIRTPTLDALAERGVRFTNMFVTLSICAPSRATVLTGRYGSANGVTAVYGKPTLRPGERTFAQILKAAGYRTGFVGKWHLQNTPRSLGFDYVTYFRSNGPYYGRTVFEAGKKKTVRGYIEDYCADQSVEFLRRCAKAGEPWVLWHCTQVPHMNHQFDWPARTATLATYDPAKMPLPKTWQDDLSGKPPYLRRARSRVRALQYGYGKPDAIRRHVQRYYGAVTEMDASLGRLVASLDKLGLAGNTWVVFLSDNGWFIGDHGFTSKVLPYEASMRVPMIVAGPGVSRGTDDHLVLNADVMPTLLDLAGLPVGPNVHGRSLLPLIRRDKDIRWRESFLYEAPTPQLGSHPLLAVRTARWKYIRTYADKDLTKLEYEELYDLQADPDEMKNLAPSAAHADQRRKLAVELKRLQEQIAHKE